MIKELKFYAQHFHSLGLIVSCMSNYRNQYNFKDRNLLKAPNHDISQIFHKGQSREILESYDWEHATGVGVLLGYKGVYALDIDGCFDFDFVQLLLKILGLPSNYNWVIKSGSGAGFHIIFRTSGIPNYCQHWESLVEIDDDGQIYENESDEEYDSNESEYFNSDYLGHLDVDAFFPKIHKKYQKRNLFDYEELKYITKDDSLSLQYLERNIFQKIEFRWSGNLVLPPSLHESGSNYSFINSIPESLPTVVEFSGLKTIHRVFCSSRADRSEYSEPLYTPILDESNESSSSSKYVFLDFKWESQGLDNTSESSEEKFNLSEIAWLVVDYNLNLIKKNCFNLKLFDFESVKSHSSALNQDSPKSDFIKKVLNQLFLDVEVSPGIIVFGRKVKFNAFHDILLRFNFNPQMISHKIRYDLRSYDGDDFIMYSNEKNQTFFLVKLYYILYKKNISSSETILSDLILMHKCFKALDLRDKISIPYY